MKESNQLTSGLCSVTLKEARPEAVIEFMVDSNLDAVEWWGGEHVAPGDPETASHIGALTRQAGKSVSSYGSYYKVGFSENSGLAFKDVLVSASALGAPTIRVWAGDKNREDCMPEEIRAIHADALRIADLAAENNISITFEFHGASLTNNNANAAQLAEELHHPNIFFSWQPPHGFTPDHCQAGLEALLHRLSTVHVYHWTIGSYERNLYSDADRTLKWPEDYNMHPLKDGWECWVSYINLIRAKGRSLPLLLEFVKDGQVAQAHADAKTLNQLIAL